MSLSALRSLDALFHDAGRGNAGRRIPTKKMGGTRRAGWVSITPVAQCNTYLTTVRQFRREKRMDLPASPGSGGNDRESTDPSLSRGSLICPQKCSHPSGRFQADGQSRITHYAPALAANRLLGPCPSLGPCAPRPSGPSRPSRPSRCPLRV